MDATKNEDQTLRAVDPGASVEAGAMPPQPGDLGVAPLVRRDGRAPEWEAYEYGEAYGEQAERWGPPREGLDAKTTALALVGLAVTLAVAIKLSGVGLTPDRYLLVMLVPALLLRRARRYLVDFIPF